MTQKTLRVILGDQLSPTLPSLKNADKKNDTILMCEVWDEATYVKHHKKKIALIFSAMRHFAHALNQQGYTVHYTKLDDEKNSGSITGEVQHALNQHTYERIVITAPAEYRVMDNVKQWEAQFNLPVEILEDTRFLCTPDEFAQWAGDKKQPRMEFFYREMRKRYAILMDDDQPVGEQWNYDASNRKRPKKGMTGPLPYQQTPDAITQEVIELVSERFDHHFGDLEPFHYAVTREGALDALELFINERLILFGDYQDAMIEGEPWLFHSHISFYLNCGLLLPMECITQAESAYRKGDAPLNAVEGFIRQILGWREYVRGIYWLKMPEYKTQNFFNAKRPLPSAYWTGETRLNCLKQCVLETKENAYAHHIQRLMVLGNFALLTGIHPDEVNEWFMIVYADAFEWVELPNVTGMALFADGGYLASKPYAAGCGYVKKMSNYCDNCTYKPSQKSGPDACPLNYLYWDFLARHRNQLASNHRLGMMYRTYDKMSDEAKALIAQDSQTYLDHLE